MEMKIKWAGLKRWALIAMCSGLLASPLMAGDRIQPSFFTRKIILNKQPFELHLAQPAESSVPAVLVLYASGDGGWYGEAVGMFEDLAGLGYAVAGFSSRSYMKQLRDGDLPTTVRDLVEDYQEISRASRLALALPAPVPVVLVGWSRGAAFSVLAGSESDFKKECAGVIAIGLPDKEELKIRRQGKHIFIANLHKASQESLLFETYDRIPEISPIPFALIQSEHDDYLPARQAKVLYGTDSGVKRFFSVQAKNHRFSGGREDFRQKLGEALAWMVKLQLLEKVAIPNP